MQRNEIITRLETAACLLAGCDMEPTRTSIENRVRVMKEEEDNEN